ncbi:polymeric immunoglobulin receptor-like [Mobula birostris]|uniref:polymeric immunoglobulin receptor-like n=1 Tax=Mobula birostris TaxID=1983395 RepID=UPI003B28B026
MELLQGEVTHQKRPRIVESIAFLFLISVGFISGSTALTEPKKVRGVVGESVTVECRYDQKYKDYVKKWCRGDSNIGCSAVVSTDQPRSERITMTDYKTRGILSVTMDNLKMTDEGLYQCIIQRAMLIPNERFTISLEISEAPEEEISTKSVWTTWTTSPQNGMHTRKGESTDTSVSLHPIRNTEQKIHYIWALTRWIVFGVLVLCTVSILCMTAFQRNMELLQGELTHQKRSRIVESITLLFLISVGLISGSTALTGPKKVRGVVGESVTVECRYDQKYKDYVKKWCRGDSNIGCSAVVSTDQPRSERITMTDYKTRGILSVTMDNLKMTDEGLYQCIIQRAMLIPNKRFTISLEISEGYSTLAPEKKATTLEISTETIWTTSPQNEMSTRKAESTESSVSSHQIRERMVGTGTKAVENLVKRKRKAYERFKKLGNVRDLEDCKASKKELKNEIRRAKRSHEKALVSRIKENPKAFYKYVKNKRIRHERIGPIKCDSGNVCGT